MLVKDYGKYRQKKQVRKLVPNKKNSRKKHYYLRELFENCALPETERKWEVYTNESYIYKYKYRNNDFIQHLNDHQDVMMERATHK